MAATANTPADLVAQLLRVTEERIVPLTRAGVAAGSKVFGAAVLAKDGLAPHTVATSDERASPLLHGEINCIQAFFASPADSRPRPSDCVFFCTHEPCSLCLSGITWSGFDEFYYLFTYQDSRDLFAIPYDIDILESVFRVAAPADTPDSLAARPLYNKTNKFFRSASLADLVGRIADPQDRARWAAEVDRVKALYNALSQTYQDGKKAGTETSSVWK
ncbi:cytidine deoxycytidylate deaminase family protein [Grosmannia clavigera kw1407]|uniref:Cytidine deoxycytidylate deaminase family protein n=1 Tax=Grosmannia clavigera (strain kw1407 / UAMH 11150) TaxID=655863 RepID=F0XQH7_GROCL|nr:cytidine deoxycytidylate deaminase family protein [Grosmannia clavigera kw1407]EFX00314.1 cytidine deoxycytidylate deaminase family protein [Grosmannia clavigera kw1407]